MKQMHPFRQSSPIRARASPIVNTSIHLIHPRSPPSPRSITAALLSSRALGETFFRHPALSLVVNPPIHHARPPSRARRRLPPSLVLDRTRDIFPTARSLSRSLTRPLSLARASSRMNEQTLRDQPSASVSRGSSGGLWRRRETRDATTRRRTTEK